MKYNILFTIKNNLCTGCGICEGACPSKAITIITKDGKFVPVIDNNLCLNNKGCHSCMDVCPGVGCNLTEISNKIHQDTANEDLLIGKYEQCFVGHTTNKSLRYHASSGGMVTQMLIWLLETKRIDGAVVTRFDNNHPFMINTYLANTPQELISAKGSKYAPVSLHGIVRMIKEATGKHYVVVGVPCHLQGLRKLMQKDKILREKITACFGLYCSCGRSFYLTEFILKERDIKRNNIKSFAYRDEGCLGYMVIKHQPRYQDEHRSSDITLYKKDEIYKEKYQNYFHPLRSFFIPKRCLFCIDHYARLSDISFGDIHIKPYSDDKIGINSIIARSPRMVKWLKQAEADGHVWLDNLSVDTLNRSQSMAQRKYNRVRTFMFVAKLLGNKVPRYDIELPMKHILRNSFDYLQTRIQQFFGCHKSLWTLVKFMKSTPPKE